MRAASLVMAGLLLLAPLAAVARPFEQGSTRVSLALGGSSAGFGVGAGVGYALIDGLEVETDAFYWFGDPDYLNLTPGVRYILLQVPSVHPYLGAFYRRQFVFEDGYDDRDFIGGRGGIFIPTGVGFIGLGVGYERQIRCDDECADGFYPELSVALSF